MAQASAAIEQAADTATQAVSVPATATSTALTPQQKAGIPPPRHGKNKNPNDQPGLQFATSTQETPAFSLLLPGDATGTALMATSTVQPPSNPINKNAQGRLVVESADYTKRETERRFTILKGGVVMEYTDRETEEKVRIRADEAAVDEKTKIATAKGNVVLSREDAELSGDALVYKFDDKYFEMTGVSGSAEGTGEVNGKVYFRGAIAHGTRSRIKVFKATCSTCGPACPSEYHFTAATITIHPERRIVARSVWIYLRHTKVMYLPLYLVNLKEKQGYMPEFGYSKIEGFYVKSKYPYLVKESKLAGVEPTLGWVIFNYMEKIGNEYGAEHKYYSKKIGGKGYSLVTTNNQKDTGNTNSKLNMQQAYTLGKKLTCNANIDRTNTYNTYREGLRTNTSAYRMNANYNQGPSKSLALDYTMNANKGAYLSENSALNMQRRAKIGKNINLDYAYRQNASQSGTATENREGNFRTTTKYMGKMYNVTMNTYKDFDLDGEEYTSDNNVSVNGTKLPEVVFDLNSGLWKKRLALLNTVQFVHGRYRRGTRADSESLRRNELVMSAGKSFAKGKRFTLNPTQTFRQRFYNTKDAMYVMEHRTAAAYKFSDSAQLGVNFNRTGDSGGTPYAEDRRSEMINLDGNFSITKRHGGEAGRQQTAAKTTSFRAGTSYNYKNRIYSPLSVGYSKYLSQNSSMEILGSRDLNSHEWNTTSTKFDIRRKNTKLMLNARWKTEDFDLDTMDFTTEHVRRNGWTTQIRGSYAHKSQQKIIRNIIATKTRCCTQLQYFYDTEREEFRFMYTILAFPAGKFGFTQGPQGLEFDESLTSFSSPQTGTGAAQ